MVEIENTPDWNEKSLVHILRKHTKDKKDFFSRDQLLAGYKYLIAEGRLEYKQYVQEKIRMKPIRTISGVTPVTVLMKPFPCPGTCIFCPNDVRMPKSYLSDEPGAQRAENNHFDPYLQTFNRLKAFESIGHNIEKIELIVLGGTWSFYPEYYRIWFIKRCFEAMNDYGIRDQTTEIVTKNIFKENADISRETESGRQRTYNELVAQIVQQDTQEFFSPIEHATWEELEEQQRINVSGAHKCIGLVIETRPDHINEQEVIDIRRLGATKVQIGIQSLDDNVLLQNKRGHTVAQTQNAIRLLRIAGFKIHAHWMPNLHTATPASDIADYYKLWQPDICPDELKIYPTSIIDNTELNELYKQGKYHPYSHEELLSVLTQVLPTTPRYCRLTRIIRDIPSTDIVAGNKLTNFRQIAEQKILADGQKCNCIRCREIKNQEVEFQDLELEILEYPTTISTEYFISYKTVKDDKIAGFLRLSILKKEISQNNFFPELQNKSMIREIHVYGQVIGIGQKEEGRSQHIGLGTKLIEVAKELSINHNYAQMAVISAIGTKDYYRKRGFEETGLYMTLNIED